MSIEPETRDELHQAALLAKAWLAIDSARAYGLVVDGPEIDFERCREILSRAEAEGIELDEDEVDATLLGVCAGMGAAR